MPQLGELVIIFLFTNDGIKLLEVFLPLSDVSVGMDFDWKPILFQLYINQQSQIGEWLRFFTKKHYFPCTILGSGFREANQTDCSLLSDNYKSG